MLTRAILRLAAPSKVVSLDPSEGFLDHARLMTKDARVEFRRGADGGGLRRGCGLEFELHARDLLDGLGVAFGNRERCCAAVEHTGELLFGVEFGETILPALEFVGS